MACRAYTKHYCTTASSTKMSNFRTEIGLPTRMNLNRVSLIAVVIFTAIQFMGCNGIGGNADDDFLIRIGDRVVTAADFNKAFEISKTAYPHSLLNDSEEFKKAKTRLLNQLTEELILEQRAADLNIVVTDTELEQAIADIKDDYPENEFEQTLLEYAIPYKTWKKGIRNRLLMEKLVEAELKDQVVITQADIARYYEKQLKEEQAEPGLSNRPRDMDEKIIRHLRREKTEIAYKAWIEKIQKNYTIDINRKLWEKLLSSQS